MASLKTIRRDDRGQLLLVGAFILAILLVALAVVLNAAVYTETLAARGSDRVDVSDTVQYRADTERALTGLVASVNENATTSRDDAEATLRAGVTDWDAVSARQQAATGRATSVTVTDVDAVTTVSQTNDSLTFTNASAASDWTVVENVTDTGPFTLSVASTDTGIPPGNATDVAALDSQAFHVEVTNSTTTWQVFVFRSGPNLTVAVASSGSLDPYTYETTYVAGDPVELDFTNARIDGTPAPNLAFYEGVSGPSSVAISNGANAAGSYTLVVDGDVVSPDDYSNDPEAGPTARAVLTRLDVTLRYELANLRYEAPISVTAGGSDV
ncbi:hypothetical protein [Haloferax sp. YSMS24]|uniref:DUF7261 family protein n=1 Tax=Haloferax sp. YSMS24 TaxID=3388425 RepID=UPI00398CFC63